MQFTDDEDSPLNPDSAGAGYNWGFLNNAGNIVVGDHDSFAIYGFALFYQDILKPEDLDRIHHYQDELDGDDNLHQDLELAIPADSSAPSYTEKIGNPYIHGAVTSSTVNVCFQNQSNQTLENGWLQRYLSFTSMDFSGGIITLLRQRNTMYSLSITIASQNCQLMVVFRDQSAYPFNDSHYSGLYAKAGSLKDVSGNPTKVPVIYLNATSLELNPDLAAGSDREYVQLVFRHEFAHFLGFKHSTSGNSIMSPASFNTAWDTTGEDKKMFAAFLNHWAKHQP